MMSDLRAAALQALEFCETLVLHDVAMSEFVEEQREIVKDVLRAALKQPEQQEPVAECIDDICSEHSGRVEAFDHLKPGTKLYAVPTPPARQPLTEDEIERLIQTYSGYGLDDFASVARAVERAHGIGGSDE